MQKKTNGHLLAISLLAAAMSPAYGADAGANQVLGEVQVTGSRILRPADQSPNPMVSITADDIAQSGLTNLTDLLVSAPQLVNSFTTNDTSGTTDYDWLAGLNLLNLRNLGRNRTLVLVNGRRHVAGIPGSAAVDINSMPVDLIERVDVLTGGVSAIYGADAVSGVVNFITKRDFEGLVVRGQYGQAGEGDAGSKHLSVTAGRNFAADRGNVAFAYEFTGDNEVPSSARAHGGDPLHTYSVVFNPDDDPDNDDPDVYDRILVNDLRWADSSPDGAIDVDGDLTPDFRGGGQTYDLGEPYYSNGLVRGGSSTPIAGYFGDLQAKTNKHLFNLLSSFEVNDSVHLYFEGKYASTKTWNLSQPIFDFYDIVGADNAFMPDNIRTAIVAGNIDTMFRDFGVIDPSDPDTIPDGVLLTRDNYDLSIKGDTATRDTIRTVIGADGTVFGSARYDLSYTFGRSKIAYDEPGQRIDERFFAALDAVDEGEFLGGTPNGNIRCRIDLEPADSVINPYNIMWGNFVPGGDYTGTPQTFTPGANSGCVPLNLFGEGVADPAAIQWIGYRAVNRQRINQHVLSASLTGDTGKALPLTAGPLSWAIGAEYRKEKSVNHPDSIYEQELLWSAGYVTDEIGQFDVKEGFAEISLPLLRDLPAAKELRLGAALRLSDYSTVGQTTTWKTDLAWMPEEQITVRGTYSESVRAPNISELFGPTQGTFLDIYDPCDTVYLSDSDDPALRTANCAAILGALGVDPTTFNPSSNTQFATTTQPGLQGGNPNLTQEKAKTWTAGLTLRPRFSPGMSVSFDWYDIKLTNAISTPTAQETINLCVDSPTPNNYCDSITRLTAPQGTYSTGFISDYLLGPQNVAAYKTSGADIAVNWLIQPVAGWGSFLFKVNAGYLDSLTFVSLPGAMPDSNRKEAYAPEWTFTSDLTWHRGPWLVNYGIDYFSKTRRYSKRLLTDEPDLLDPKYFWFKSKLRHDLQASYDWNEGVKITGGLNNIFNAKPAITQESYPNGWAGRFFYLGASFRIDQL